MPAVNPVKLLVKLPIPLPLLVRESAIVGLGDVLQQTPRRVTSVTPDTVTFPPQEAEISVTSVTE